MFTVKKRVEISSAHKLNLPYESKCKNFHGHNWVIDITCQSEKLNESGMVLDFVQIKKKIVSQLDHTNLNDTLDFNPTAENIAKWICEQIPFCVKVEVQESEGNTAIYER